MKDKRYLEYSDGKITDKTPDIDSSQNFNQDEEENEALLKLKNIEELSRLIDEIDASNTSEKEFSSRIDNKEYIDVSEHKSVNEFENDSWLEEKPKIEEVEKKEEPENNNSDKQSKANIKIPKFSAYNIFVGIVILVIVLFFISDSLKNNINKNNNNNNETEIVVPVVNDNKKIEYSKEELVKISNLMVTYNNKLKDIISFRESELKLINGYAKGEYKDSELINLVSQTASKKDLYLAETESANLEIMFHDVQELMERYIRSELNAAKKVMVNIQNGLKPAEILNDFTKSGNTAKDYLNDVSNEMQRLLDSANISYERIGNYFEF